MSKQSAKLQFGKRLYKLMIEKGWTQSELARQADLPRDSVSNYVRGNSLPTSQSLKRLGDALGVNLQELLPESIQGGGDNDDPAFEVRQSLSEPGIAWLRVNRPVTMQTAVKVTEILANDNSTSRK